MSFILSLQNISKSFTDRPILNRICLNISEGEFVTILGPSGSGKTTILKIITGVEIPDEGRVLLKDSDVTGLEPQERRIPMVWQNLALFPHLDVKENIVFGLKLQNLNEKEIESKLIAMLDLLSISRLVGRYIHSLSGGEKQRVALARALILNEPIILLDEPFTGLDYNTAARIQLELKKIQRELGITILMVTHHQYEASVLSDKIAILHEAVIQQYGTPQDIIENPKNEFVENFVKRADIFFHPENSSARTKKE